MMNGLSRLFEEEPVQWGLRGDPLLWNEIKLELETIAFPAGIDDFRKLLYSMFYQLTGEEPAQGKNIYVPRYGEISSGMSSGVVCSDFWIEKGFPLILQRYEENMKNRMDKIKDISALTWQELEILPKEKTILFLTFAPVEEHSQHLPLGVDLILGENWKEKAIQLITEKHTDFYILTMDRIPFAQGTIKGFPGNLHVKQKTVYRVAFELLECIAGWGIRNIVIIASHGEPKHLIAIEEACEKINKKYGICSISPMGSFFSYNELGIDLNFPALLKEQLEKYPNDFHAGWLETSAILDINEQYVKDGYQDLPDLKVEEKEMIFPKKVNKKIAGYGHIGFPRFASRELGKLINESTAEFIYKATMAFVRRKGYKIYEHHSLYKLPFMKTNFVRNVFLLIGFIIGLFIIILIYKI
ncbi:MAG: creatininase family protein [Bacteroidales bacterium]|jgi:creatinine amidohydrolase|nr:creatininase family protein [Bacteroidales bacterium]